MNWSVRPELRLRPFQKPTVLQPFLEAFDPFAGELGVVRPQAKAVARPGVDVQFGRYVELFELEIHAGQAFRYVGLAGVAAANSRGAHPPLVQPFGAGHFPNVWNGSVHSMFSAMAWKTAHVAREILILILVLEFNPLRMNRL